MNPKLVIDERLLILVEGLARDGLTDEQISQKLGITARSLYNYISKYPELRAAMARGKAPIDYQAENALLKKCLGCRVEKVCTTIHADGSVTEKRTVT
ncbi:MAG: helix-turn-helix domain-containing protein, partial [Erysipelotrichia bacterium]|nr:helix-turn-helix domain-containing protein [Erysipelotrichia bacterium]